MAMLTERLNNTINKKQLLWLAVRLYKAITQRAKTILMQGAITLMLSAPNTEP